MSKYPMGWIGPVKVSEANPLVIGPNIQDQTSPGSIHLQNYTPICELFGRFMYAIFPISEQEGCMHTAPSSVPKLAIRRVHA